MGGAGTAGRGVPVAGEGGAAEPAPDDERDPVASSEWSEVAGGARGNGTLVDGRPDVHPLVQARRVGATADPGAEGPRQAGHDVPRRDQHPRPSEGCMGTSKEETSVQRDEREALGWSQGGFGTSVRGISQLCCLIVRDHRCDWSGRRLRVGTGPGPRAASRYPAAGVSCPACRNGWSPTGGIAATPSASTSGTWAHDRRSRPVGMRRHCPVHRGSTPTATRSSGWELA